MRRTRGRVVDIDSVADLDRRLAAGARRLSGWRFRAVDLRARGDELAECAVAGAMFLGCRLPAGMETDLETRGAIVFPSLPDVPIETYRSSLYTPRELYGEGPYVASPDARAYAWTQSRPDADQLLAAALHDHAIDEALGAWVADRSLIGVMGGHALQRDEAPYVDAARLGRLLGARHTVATGGGPGAMEAANLGAATASSPATVLDHALEVLATAPGFRPDIGAWADAGFRALDLVPDPEESLGIPTWHYGHEPPNVFATAIAKYLRNAIREAILLEVCDAGIVFLPGAAGTVQEVFQDACENYYADPASIAPMVLVGHRYWTETLPVWPLLSRLAEGRPLGPAIHLVDTVEEAAEAVG